MIIHCHDEDPDLCISLGNLTLLEICWYCVPFLSLFIMTMTILGNSVSNMNFYQASIINKCIYLYLGIRKGAVDFLYLVR